MKLGPGSFLLAFCIAIGSAAMAFVPQQGSNLDNLSDGDLKDFKITLERTTCYGDCPAYKLTVYGDGRVEYEGQKFVRVVGRKEGQIKPEGVKEIISAALSAKYFTLGSFTLDDCGSCRRCTDLPAANTAITVKGQSHSVKHDFGCGCATKELWALEETIDRAANSKQWTGDVSKSGPRGTTCF